MTVPLGTRFGGGGLVGSQLSQRPLRPCRGSGPGQLHLAGGTAASGSPRRVSDVHQGHGDPALSHGPPKPHSWGGLRAGVSTLVGGCGGGALGWDTGSAPTAGTFQPPAEVRGGKNHPVVLLGRARGRHGLGGWHWGQGQGERDKGWGQGTKS